MDRTRYLFVLAAMLHLDKLISPPIATALMVQNLYLPSIVLSVILVLCILLIRNVKNPEQARKTTPNETNQSREPLLNDNREFHAAIHSGDSLSPGDSPDSSRDVQAEATSLIFRRNMSVTKSLLSQILYFKKISRYLGRNRTFSFCCLAFYLKSNAMASEAFVFQYLSEKFWLAAP